MGYLVSIVIPTKDRYKYLKHLVSCIKSFNNDEIEVVVHDNTDDNTEFVSFLKELNYEHCHYYHEIGFIPMSENADKAILHSSGEYVCFLGDDDGVCPNVTKWAQYMKSNKIGALRSNLPSYYWPDASSSSKPTGVLTYTKKESGMATLNSEDALKDVFQRGFIDRGDLPSVYHGLVSRAVLDDVYKKCNTFFPGQSPDISNGVAVSLVLDSFVKTNAIVTISGASKYHGGKVKGMNSKYPAISDMKWFRPGAEEIWDKRLPRMAEGVTIWAESTIETLHNMGRDDLVNWIDFESIYKNFVTFYYPVRQMAYKYSSNRFLPFYAHFSFARRVFRGVKRRVYSKFGIATKGQVIITGVQDINHCISLL